MSTWKGIKVKHQDGREGVIASDYAGFMHRGLQINVVGGEDAYVQLNSDGPDSGEAGWSWGVRTFLVVPGGYRLETTSSMKKIDAQGLSLF